MAALMGFWTRRRWRGVKRLDRASRSMLPPVQKSMNARDAAEARGGATSVNESSPSFNMERLASDAFMQCIVGRRSVRRMHARRVERELLESLVEAACWAPSPHKAQPWRFAVVDEPPRLERLAHDMAAAFRADLEGDGVEPAIIERLCVDSIERFSNASAMLIPCLSMETMRGYPDAARKRAEENMAIMSAGAALQNLMLRAHSLGLATCWYSAPLFCQEAVARALSLPEAWRPLAIVIVGYAASEPPLPPRREFHSLMHYADKRADARADETAS